MVRPTAVIAQLASSPREADIRSSGREHVRRMVRGVGVHGLLVAFGSANFHHQGSAQDFECRGIVAGCAITRGSFVIDHHPTLYRSQRGREAKGGGDVTWGGRCQNEYPTPIAKPTSVFCEYPRFALKLIPEPKLL